jgi:uncharacterized integral membrane protein
MSWEQRGGDAGEPAKRGGGLGLEAFLFAIVALAIGAFIGQNTDEVRIDWAMFHFSMPLWLMLLIVLVLGALLDRLATAIWRHRRSRRESS